MITKKQLERVIQSLQKQPRNCAYCPCKSSCDNIKAKGRPFTKEERQPADEIPIHRKTTINTCIRNRILWIVENCDEKGKGLEID